jgi:hypothetical protein
MCRSPGTPPAPASARWPPGAFPLMTCSRASRRSRCWGRPASCATCCTRPGSWGSWSWPRRRLRRAVQRAARVRRVALRCRRPRGAARHPPAHMLARHRSSSAHDRPAPLQRPWTPQIAVVGRSPPPRARSRGGPQIQGSSRLVPPVYASLSGQGARSASLATRREAGRPRPGARTPPQPRGWSAGADRRPSEGAPRRHAARRERASRARCGCSSGAASGARPGPRARRANAARAPPDAARGPASGDRAPAPARRRSPREAAGRGRAGRPARQHPRPLERAAVERGGARGGALAPGAARRRPTCRRRTQR